LPDAVLSPDGLIGAPSDSRSPQAHEPVYKSDNYEGESSSGLSEELAHGVPPPGHDPPPVRRAHAKADAETGPEPPGERIYHEVFNPAVFPFKRMTVLDEVDEKGVLRVHDPRQRELKVKGSRLSPGRDPFYGSVVVEFVAGQKVALPTPAAAVRLLGYRVTPEVPLKFFADGADNLYVEAQGADVHDGPHRLVYLVDAEQRYFGGPLSSAAPSTEDGGRTEAPAIPTLPRSLRRDADKVLRQIGIRPGSRADYAETLGSLVGYFRAFEMGELPNGADESRSALYLRIALSQRGVCRHRAYAFVITALALGIPARYVENELHVFVEVFVPTGGHEAGYWRRINLGGAPLSQRVYGGERRQSYRIKGDDPFTRPPSFAQAQKPQVSGLPPTPASGNAPRGGFADPQPRTDAGEGSGPKPPRLAAPPAAGAAQGPARLPRSGGSAGPADARPAPGGEPLGTDTDADAPARLADDRIEQPDDSRAGASAEALIPTSVTVAVTPVLLGRGIYRGTTVSVHGQVRATQGLAANLEVALILGVPQHPLLLGRTVTRSDGSFTTEVEIPATAPLGRFAIVARVRGDETRRGSSSSRYDRLDGRATGAEDFVENE
jgi:hypothetical protein